LLFYDFIGYISIFFLLLSFFSQGKQTMRLYGLLSAAFFGISIFGYQGYNGVFVSFISIIIKGISLKYSEEKLIFFKKLSFPIALLFYFFINNEGFYGLLPALAIIFIIYADTQKDILNMKKIYYGSAFSWLFYAIMIGSLPAIIYDVIGIIVLTYTIYKISHQRKGSSLSYSPVVASLAGPVEK